MLAAGLFLDNSNRARTVGRSIEFINVPSGNCLSRSANKDSALGKSPTQAKPSLLRPSYRRQVRRRAAAV
jgi:hypothetical protein